jgi:hypothetical protein
MSSLYEIYFNVVLESITAKWARAQRSFGRRGQGACEPLSRNSYSFADGKMSWGSRWIVAKDYPRCAAVEGRWRMVGKVRDTILISPAHSLTMN